MLPGHWRGKDVTILTTYEGVGSVLAGRMTEAELDELGHACAPTLGSCPGQFTANTMAMVAETLGLALPGSAMLPAVYTERLALARRAGRRATEIVSEGGPLPRDLVTRQVARERLRRGRRDRRLDQRRPAPAGDRARGRRPLHARRRRRGVRAHAADRRPAAGRSLPRPRPAPRRRRRAGAEGAARRRPSARRHARALGPHARRRARERAGARRRSRSRGSERRCMRPAASSS